MKPERDRTVEMRRRVVVPLAIATALVACATGCASWYAVRLTVMPDAAMAAPVGSAEMVRVVEIVARIAADFDLVPSRNLASIQALSAERDTFPFAVAAEFICGERGVARCSSVLVSVGKVKADGVPLVLIRSWHECDETPFLASLKSAIETALAEAFPSCRVTVERLHDTPWWYRP